MRLQRALHIGAIFAVMTLATSSAGAWPHKHGQKARVHFPATSTLIRGTWGQNEDTYLAQLHLPKQNEAVLVGLVDAYPNEWPPLGRKILSADAGSVLPVKRDQDCDRPFGEILLRRRRRSPGHPAGASRLPSAACIHAGGNDERALLPGVAAVNLKMYRVNEGKGQLESTARDMKKEGISDHG